MNEEPLWASESFWKKVAIWVTARFVSDFGGADPGLVKSDQRRWSTCAGLCRDQQKSRLPISRKTT